MILHSVSFVTDTNSVGIIYPIDISLAFFVGLFEKIPCSYWKWRLLTVNVWKFADLDYRDSKCKELLEILLNVCILFRATNDGGLGAEPLVGCCSEIFLALSSDHF